MPIQCVKRPEINPSLRPHPLFECASSESSRSGDTVRIRWLPRCSTARIYICDNYKNSHELTHLLTVSSAYFRFTAIFMIMRIILSERPLQLCNKIPCASSGNVYAGSLKIRKFLA